MCIIGRKFASPAKPGARAEHAKERAVEKYIRKDSLTPLLVLGPADLLLLFH